MPFSAGTFSRIWTFLNIRAAGDPISRSEMDTAFNDAFDSMQDAYDNVDGRLDSLESDVSELTVVPVIQSFEVTDATGQSEFLLTTDPGLPTNTNVFVSYNGSGRPLVPEVEFRLEDGPSATNPKKVIIIDGSGSPLALRLGTHVLIRVEASSTVPVAEYTSQILRPSGETMEAFLAGLEARNIASHAALLADTILTYTAGEAGTVPVGYLIACRDGFTRQVAASGATDHHFITAGGVKLYEAGQKYSARARLLEAISRGATWPDGTIIEAADRKYRAESGYVATVSAMNGLRPLTPRIVWNGDSNHTFSPSRPDSDAEMIEDFATQIGVPLQVIQASVGGASFETALNNFWRDEDGNSADQVDKIEDFDPDAVVVSLGTNDCLGAYDQSLRSITAITQANPAVVTIEAGSHYYQNGDEIVISGVGGMTELNGRTFTIANLSGQTFELSGEDSTGHTAYASGGSVAFERYPLGRTRAANIARVQADVDAYIAAVKSKTSAPILIMRQWPWDRQSGSVVTVPNTVTALPNRLVIAKLHRYLPGFRVVSGVTQANPGVVTTTSNHDLQNGDKIMFTGVGGMTELNGNTYIVANRTATTFELSGTDTSGFAAFTSGGSVGIPIETPTGELVLVNGDNRVENSITFRDLPISELDLDRCMVWQELNDHLSAVAAADSQVSVVGESDMFRLRMFMEDGLHYDRLGRRANAANNFSSIRNALPELLLASENTKWASSDIYSADINVAAFENGVDYGDAGSNFYDPSRVVGGFGRDYVASSIQTSAMVEHQKVRIRRQYENWIFPGLPHMAIGLPTCVKNAACPVTFTLDDIPVADTFRVWNPNTGTFQSAIITNHNGNSAGYNKSPTLSYSAPLTAFMSGSPPQQGNINVGVGIQEASLAHGYDQIIFWGELEVQEDWLRFSRPQARVVQPSATVTGITAANPPVVTTSAGTNFITGDTVSFADLQEMAELNEGSYAITVLTSTTFSLNGVDATSYTPETTGGTVSDALGDDAGAVYAGQVAVTGITAANPPVVTTGTSHGLTTGNVRLISDLSEMTELNNRLFTVTVLSSTTFSLDGVDASAYTAETTGGILSDASNRIAYCASGGKCETSGRIELTTRPSRSGDLVITHGAPSPYRDTPASAGVIGFVTGSSVELHTVRHNTRGFSFRKTNGVNYDATVQRADITDTFAVEFSDTYMAGG